MRRATMIAPDCYDPTVRPPLLMTSDPGTFQQNTIINRKPSILNQMLEIGGQPEPVNVQIRAFLREIHGPGPVAMLPDGVHDADRWRTAFAPYRGRGWLEIPWFLAEMFFYRRVLHMTGFYENDRDPFAPVKGRELEEEGTWAFVSRSQTENLHDRLLLSVWGNRVDLSFLDRQHTADQDQDRANLLVDESERLAALFEAGPGHLALVADNVGTELLMDLHLIDRLLRMGWRVTHHLKAAPMFVSDALIRDVEGTLAALNAHGFGKIAGRLEAARADGSYVLVDHEFWTGPHFFDKLPLGIFGDSDLVLLKGDANYRRVVGDYHWEWKPTTPLAAAAGYFPKPFAMLRTMKSDPVVGLCVDQVARLAREDPKWRTNGKRGVVQGIF